MSTVEEHNIIVKCNLPQKVAAIEEVLLTMLSADFSDFYDPNTLHYRVRMATKVACIDKIVHKRLKKILEDYQISNETYENLFCLFKKRSIIATLMSNKLRHKDIKGYDVYEVEFLRLTNTIGKASATIKRKVNI